MPTPRRRSKQLREFLDKMDRAIEEAETHTRAAESTLEFARAKLDALRTARELGEPKEPSDGDA